MSNTGTTSELLNTPQAAEMLGITRFYLSRLARQGTVPYAYKAQGRTGVYLFRREDIERLAAERVA